MFLMVLEGFERVWKVLEGFGKGLEGLGRSGDLGRLVACEEATIVGLGASKHCLFLSKQPLLAFEQTTIACLRASNYCLLVWKHLFPGEVFHIYSIDQTSIFHKNKKAVNKKIFRQCILLINIPLVA